MAAKNFQGDQAGVGVPLGGVNVNEAVSGSSFDLVKPKPDEMVSRRSNAGQLSAGRHAFWKEYQIGKSGISIMLPMSEEGPQESISEVPLWMWPAIINYNRSQYGDDWWDRFSKEVIWGESPRYVPESERPVPWYKRWYLPKK